MLLHGAFFLGPKSFYRALREMTPQQLARIQMMPVSFTNQLYGGEEIKRRARVDARFVNNAMMATLMGAVISDGLENGQVVSGVGGQYNFVAQGHELEGARTVIMLRASRTVRGKAASNLRWRYGHVTIPRHLRDIIVTAYGIADIRGKSDRDVIARMLAITDSRFQDELLREAKDAGKIERTFELAKSARDNTPDALARALRPATDAGLLPRFPFGTDFTAAEQRLLPALQLLKSSSPAGLAALLLRGMFAAPADPGALERLRLAKPQSLAERLSAWLVGGALSATDQDAAA